MSPTLCFHPRFPTSHPSPMPAFHFTHLSFLSGIIQKAPSHFLIHYPLSFNSIRQPSNYSSVLNTLIQHHMSKASIIFSRFFSLSVYCIDVFQSHNIDLHQLRTFVPSRTVFSSCFAHPTHADLLLFPNPSEPMYRI